MRIKETLALFALGLAIAASAHAGVSRQERKQAKEHFSGPLYIRFNAPCTQGRHPFGVYYSPLVEVSPTGTNADVPDGGTSVGWYHASSVVWSIRINDRVELDEMDWGAAEGSVEIELDGIGPGSTGHTVIKFVNIHTLQDFQAAFDQAFSRQPLQEDHPDWPPEVRQAISERRLINGMTKRQAYYIVGTPEKVQQATEADKVVETWTLPRQGVQFGYFSVKAGDQGMPGQTLRFEDGILVNAAGSVSSGTLDLDDP